MTRDSFIPLSPRTWVSPYSPRLVSFMYEGVDHKETHAASWTDMLHCVSILSVRAQASGATKVTLSLHTPAYQLFLDFPARWGMDSPYIDERLYAHRRIPRQHMPVPLLCKVSRNKHSALGWVRDFSRTGANVTSSLPLLPGNELTLSVPVGRRPELTISATVRWTQGPLVGVEFTPTIRNLFSSI